jgi:hypothetical protein
MISVIERTAFGYIVKDAALRINIGVIDNIPIKGEV